VPDPHAGAFQLAARGGSVKRFQQTRTGIPRHLDRQFNLAHANASECALSVPNGAAWLCSVALRGPRTSSVMKVTRESERTRDPHPPRARETTSLRAQAEAARLRRVVETMALAAASHGFGHTHWPSTPHFQRHGSPEWLVLVYRTGMSAACGLPLVPVTIWGWATFVRVPETKTSI
jgi:hypothetical protein